MRIKVNGIHRLGHKDRFSVGASDVQPLLDVTVSLLESIYWT
ncbi:MAG: hypothetical protein WBC04_04810 [Candidatus Acidiferrales bacterium]